MLAISLTEEVTAAWWTCYFNSRSKNMLCLLSTRYALQNNNTRSLHKQNRKTYCRIEDKIFKWRLLCTSLFLMFHWKESNTAKINTRKLIKKLLIWL
jgi:uncharacterized protein YecE (DUF72 family)